MPAVIIASIKDANYSLYRTITMPFPKLHGNLFQSVFQYDNAEFVNSTCVDMLSVDVINGTATVCFTDGGLYKYTNVSRRAILKFIMDDARSLGKFVNCVLKQQRCVAREVSYARPNFVLAN